MGEIIQQLEDREAHTEDDNSLLRQTIGQAQVGKPDGAEYKQKVLDCQEFLRSGDSYELCLTDQTDIRLPHVGYAKHCFYPF